MKPKYKQRASMAEVLLTRPKLKIDIEAGNLSATGKSYVEH
jgi:hypothetical protein